jgi:hypothetical protein
MYWAGVSPCATSRRDMPRWPRRRTTGCACRSRPATAGPRPGSASIMCLRGMTRRPPLGRCHAAAAHSPARARATFRHWPKPRRTSPTASAPMPTPLWTRSPGRTAYTRYWTYKPPFFPSRVHVAAPVHHWRRRWASCSACAHDPPATPGPSLAPTCAPARAHSLAFAHIVPESEPRRSCGHCLTAGQHQSPLRPNLRRQSSSYVHLWSFVPFVGQVRPAITTGELSPRRRGMLTMIEILQGLLCKPRGISVKF